MRTLLAVLILAAWPGLAGAQLHGGAADIRVGDHGSFARLVLSLPAGIAVPDAPQGARDGDSLILALPGAGKLSVAPHMTARRVLGVQGGQDQLRLLLQPGSTARLWRMGRRIVIDIFPGEPKAAPAAIPPGSAAARALDSAPARPPTPAPEPVPPPVENAGMAEEAALPPPVLVDTEALRAIRLPGPGDAILLPFERHVGAAAFAADGLGHAVFDDSKAIDLAALRDDPVFGGARITLSPGATHLSMAVPPGGRLGLARQAQGWVLSVQSAQAERRPAPVRLREDALTITMKQAAQVVVLVDPATGGRLLVGTVHDHGDAVVIGHVSPEFRLLPSWEGVVAAVTADRLALQATRQGFALTVVGRPALSTLMADADQEALESAGTLTRRFDIPPLSVARLRQRLDGDVSAAAHAPLQARFAARLAAAQDMLGLGMDREAASLLEVARHDDPSEEGRPDAAALAAMAQWLRGDAQGPAMSAIDNPRLGASDEVALWRALMPPRAGAAPAMARAAVVAADWRLLTAYPAPLRARLVPAGAAVLIEGKALAAASALMTACPDLPLGLERARLLGAQGKADDALAALDALARGQDRRQAAMALRDSVELRLAGHRISPGAAARALDMQLYGWRDPDFELARRLRIAALRTQAGDYRNALAGLRESERLFPDALAQVQAGEVGTVGALVRSGGAAKLAPLDLVALVQDNADLLGQGEIAASLTPVLVDKLVALDLPERADRLVSRLIDRTQDPVPKALLGARLAGLRLDQNDPAGALAALDQTMGDALPDEAEARRAVMRARALAQLGEDGPALSLLAGHDGAESWEMQAQLREKSHDWHGAEVVLQKLVQADVPAGGALTPAQQDLVLRLAGAASQAGDSATLRTLAAGAARRLSPGPRADLFAGLAVQPVRDVGDLARAQRETAAAATLPAAWAGYAGH